MRQGALVLLAVAVCACGTSPEVRQRPPAVVGVNAQPPTKGEGPSRWWLRKARIFEQEGRWDLDVILDLGGAEVPKTRVPFRFDLRMEVFYEASADGRMVRAVPVEGEPVFTFEQNVCFRSSRSRRFRVPLALGRGDGFREGEYRLTVTRDDTGEQLGETAKVVLHPASG